MCNPGTSEARSFTVSQTTSWVLLRSGGFPLLADALRRTMPFTERREPLVEFPGVFLATCVHHDTTPQEAHRASFSGAFLAEEHRGIVTGVQLCLRILLASMRTPYLRHRPST